MKTSMRSSYFEGVVSRVLGLAVLASSTSKTTVTWTLYSIVLRLIDDPIQTGIQPCDHERTMSRAPEAPTSLAR
jgi:hypothetical protein